MVRADLDNLLTALDYIVGPGLLRPSATPREINGDPNYRDCPPLAIGEAAGELADLAAYGYLRLAIPVTVDGVSDAPRSIPVRVRHYGEQTEDWEIDGEMPRSYLPEDRLFPPACTSGNTAQALFLFGLLSAASAGKPYRLDPLPNGVEWVWQGQIPNVDYDPAITDPADLRSHQAIDVMKGRIRVQQIGLDVAQDPGFAKVVDKTLSILKLDGQTPVIGEV